MYDLIDENDTPLGTTADYATVHSKGLWRRGVNVILYTDDGRAIIQKRAVTLDLFPDLFEISVGGGVDLGETPEQAALREIHEELSITLTADDLTFVGKTKFSYKSESFVTNAILYCYKVRISDTEHIAIDSDETQSFQLVPIEDLKGAVDNYGIGRFGTLAPRETLWRLLLNSVE